MYAIIEAIVLAFINKYGMMAGRFLNCSSPPLRHKVNDKKGTIF